MADHSIQQVSKARQLALQAQSRTQPELALADLVLAVESLCDALDAATPPLDKGITDRA